MSRKILTIWFESNGDMLEYAHRYLVANPGQYGAKSETGKDFNDKLEYKNLGDRTRFVSLTSGREYNMFNDEFDRLLKSKKFIDNQVEGLFRFEKRGQAQAIKLVLPDDKP